MTHFVLRHAFVRACLYEPLRRLWLDARFGRRRTTLACKPVTMHHNCGIVVSLPVGLHSPGLPVFCSAGSLRLSVSSSRSDPGKTQKNKGGNKKHKEQKENSTREKTKKTREPTHETRENTKTKGVCAQVLRCPVTRVTHTC